jgi:hypothetical protein
MRFRGQMSHAPEDVAGWRAGRGWGPFSGAQLTIVICVVAVTILLPVSAFAVVSGSNSFVTDATTGKQAQVDAKNNLKTAVHDAVSGTAAKVNALGQQLAAVTGTVTVNGIARPANPVDMYTTSAAVPGCQTFPAPAGHALVITSVDLVVPPGTAANEFVLQRGIGSCPGSFTALQKKEDATVPALSSHQITFPSGLVIPDGYVLLVATFGNDFVSVNGYLVPDSYCTPATACLNGG